MELLAPIVEKAAEIEKYDEQIQATAQLRDALPACFAIRLKALLEAEQATLAEQIRLLDTEIQGLTDSLKGLQDQQFNLKQSIANDKVGQQLTRVQEELEDTIETERQRRVLAGQYQKILGELGVKDEVIAEPQFTELQQWAEGEQIKQSGIITSAANEKATAEQEFKRLGIQHKNLDDELRSLRNRPDLIPERERRMREFIAQGADVDVVDLPFAGELMDVRPEFQSQWRGALERLLRGFGLSLLVPEHLYSRVNRFINDNDLRGRVVYHRVPRDVPAFQPSHDRGRVIERMQLKDGHPLSRWVESELRTHFNYRCCESIEEFESASCRLFYWGDMDTHGFEALSCLRNAFPHIVSVMMDEITFNTFSEFAIKASESRTSAEQTLTLAENNLYDRLSREGLLLEQERIPNYFSERQLFQALTTPF